MRVAVMILQCVLFSQVPGAVDEPTPPVPTPAPLMPGQPAGERPLVTEPAPLRPGEEALPLQPSAGAVPPAASGPMGSGAPVAAPGAAPASVVQAADTGALVPIAPASRRGSAADMVAAALTLPANSPLVGEPLALAEGLASAGSPLERLRVTHAYWQLAGAVAQYRFCQEQKDQLSLFAVRAEDGALLRTAQAASAAALQMALVAVLEAQHNLAEAAGFSLGRTLPLPADLPHTGSYRTYFDEMFASRTPPGRTRLIHRTLPLRRQAIEVRAAAAAAADDALQAAVEAYSLGRADLPLVLGAWQRLMDEKRAMMRAVCDYNHDIADYALAVSDPQTSAESLVGMLIRPRARSEAPAGPQGRSGTWNAPAENRAAEPAASGVQPATMNEPAAAPSDEAAPAAPPAPASPPAQPLPSSGTGRPTLAPPRPPGEGQVSGQPTPWAANRLDPDAAGALYADLLQARPSLKAKRLAQSLYVAAKLQALGQPIALGPCLGKASAASRQVAIDAYWKAAARVAEYQARVQQSEMLLGLRPDVLRRRHGPYGAEAMLDLRAAQLSADADSLEAHAALMAAQFELTRAAGEPGDGPWLLPATVPHAGAYLLRLETLPRSLAESWSVRRLAATVPALGGGVGERAVSVVDADLSRTEALAGYRSGTRSVEAVLAAIARQTAETLALVDAMTRYNRAIGQYALAVLPSSISGDELAESLVVVR